MRLRFNGKLLRELRENSQLSREALAQKIRCPSGAVSISRWETGTAEPKTSSVFALARVLKAPVESFYCEVER